MRQANDHGFRATKELRSEDAGLQDHPARLSKAVNGYVLCSGRCRSDKRPGQALHPFVGGDCFVA